MRALSKSPALVFVDLEDVLGRQLDGRQGVLDLVGDLAGHLGPGHLLAHLGQLLLVGLEVPDHRVEAVDEGHHLVPGLVLDGHLEVAQADLAGPGQELADGNDDHALDAAGEDDDEDDEEGREDDEELDDLLRGLVQLLPLEGEGQGDEERRVLGLVGDGQGLEGIAAEPRPLDEEGLAVIDQGLVGLPVEDLREQPAREELAPARSDAAPRPRKG